MAAGTKARTAFGVTRMAQLVRLLQAARQRLQHSLETFKSLSVLLLWLPRLVSVLGQGLRRRLRQAASLLLRSLSLTAPQLLLQLLQLQQALIKLPLALLRLARRAVRRLLPRSSVLRLQISLRLLRLQAAVALLKARAHRRLQSQQTLQRPKSSGNSNQARPLVTQNSPPPVQPGRRQREE